MRLVLTALLLGAAALAPSPDDAVDFTDVERARILRHSPLGPPPPSTNEHADDDRAAHLGRFLFFEPRLSANGAISCATCHDPQQSFTDGATLPEGLQVGVRNTPALWNVAWNRWYFWDGRADSGWAQALGPLENPLEMGSNRLALAHLVAGDADLRAAYESIFGALPDLDDRARFPAAGRPAPANPDDLHRAWIAMDDADRAAVDRVYTNLGKALDAYERRLVSRRAPFDVFVEGLRENDAAKRRALSPAAQRGLRLFIGKGECRVCHAGPNFTDAEFHDVRVPPLDGGQPTDPGRYRGIGLLRASPFNAAGAFAAPADGRAAGRLEFLADAPHLWGAFKTPSLRNVALTAPYMHQGQFDSLARVIDYYSTLRGALPPDHHDETILVPRHFSGRQRLDLLEFLKSLTDTDIDPALLKAPESPMLDSPD